MTANPMIDYETNFKPDAEIGPPNIHAAGTAILCWREGDALSRYCISRTSRSDVIAAFHAYPDLRYRVASGPLADIAAQVAADEGMQAMWELGP